MLRRFLFRRSGDPSPIQPGRLRFGVQAGAVSREPRLALPIPDATADREGCGAADRCRRPRPALLFPLPLWMKARFGGVGFFGGH